MSVYELGNGLRLVDLTKVLDPATESRRCHLIRYNTGGPIPDFHTALDLTTHLGTHCECPYHHFEDGKSVGDLPLTTFMGRAIYVNIDFLEPNAHIGRSRSGPCMRGPHQGRGYCDSGQQLEVPSHSHQLPTARMTSVCSSMPRAHGGSATTK